MPVLPQGDRRPAAHGGRVRRPRLRPCRARAPRRGARRCCSRPWPSIPASGQVHYNLGEVARVKGDVETARREYTAALDDPVTRERAQARLQALREAGPPVPRPGLCPGRDGAWPPLVVFRRGRTREAEGASVLLVTIDTLRADHVGAYGAKTGATPQLDALAARGTVFEEALASVPLTLPSHAIAPQRTGAAASRRARERPLDLPRGRADAWPPSSRVAVTRRRRSSPPTSSIGGSVSRGGSISTTTASSGGARARACSNRSGRARSSPTPAEQWIGRQAGPFFAWVHFYEPHAPYDPPSPYREQQAGRPYDGEVAAADACLGRVVAAAEARARPGSWSW